MKPAGRACYNLFLGSALFQMACLCASAQELTGIWGSSLYRVELKVDGTNVTGTFTLAQDTHSPTGTISGQIRHDGRSFMATWTMPTGVDTWNCSTWLGFAARDGLLTGYRWSDETQPAAFALHRAIDGHVPMLADQDDGGDAGSGQDNTDIKPVPPANGGETMTDAPKPPPPSPAVTNDTRSAFQRWKDNDRKQFQEWKQRDRH